MLILAIDTSCDDTSASLLEAAGSGVNLLTNVVSSQSHIHTKYGGIVPELASRRHIEMIWPVVHEALNGTSPSNLSAVAVCQGPGLIGSLLVGCAFAKAMCYPHGVPLVAVNHLEGHVLSAFLSEPQPEFPFISLLVSGGHTALYLANGFLNYTELGRTRDDAAGEAYDKVAKMLGLGYPGGPAIDRLAKQGDETKIRFPRAYMNKSLDFSFSGLKTAVRLALEKDPSLLPQDVAAAFQDSVCDVLVKKTGWAVKQLGIHRVSIAGGVAANSGLRSRMSEMARNEDIELYLPPPALCTDNAAMIAVAGYHHLNAGHRADLSLNPKAYLPL